MSQHVHTDTPHLTSFIMTSVAHESSHIFVAKLPHSSHRHLLKSAHSQTGRSAPSPVFRTPIRARRAPLAPIPGNDTLKLLQGTCEQRSPQKQIQIVPLAAHSRFCNTMPHPSRTKEGRPQWIVIIQYRAIFTTARPSAIVVSPTT